MTDIEKTLKERGATYGDFDAISSVTQSLKDVFRQGPCWRSLGATTQEGLDMLATKIARAICANGEYDDTFRDLVGYSQLLFKDIDSRFKIIRDRLKYDPDTGIFTWVHVPFKPALEGTVAGVPHKNGYTYIKIDQRSWTAGRLAYFMQTGVLPYDHMFIDHINGDKSDNRWINLRLVDPTVNSYNSKRPPNRTGFQGVSIHRANGLYRARFTNKGHTQIKYFETPEEAHEQYTEWKNQVVG